ncbi:MAG: carboxypeptidase regulatory-like domain-containing protein [Gemmatimonadetes bacterium]|nr:carboxypeptidase regulatory-like domain-containing protein [Gemmatimonadota bacterium]
MPEPAESLRLAAIALAATGLLTSAPAAAQTIHGELVEKESRMVVPGAFVILLDERDVQRDAALTDAEGRFVLVAPGPGDYVLGLDRIGYFSTRTDPIPLAEGQTIRYRLETIVAPVRLEDIDVSLTSECRIRPEEGQTVAHVWEEARKALNVTAFTQQMGLLRFTVVARERVLDPFTLRVRDESVRRRTGVTHGSPFVALPPSVLSRVGYARFDAEEQVYYAPDAVTLLSDAFLDTHCFRLREDRPPGQPGRIGIEFEPVRDHRLPDIRGTLWIDERSAELERLEYRYTNLPRAHEAGGAGGEIEFDRLPTGEWIIRDWRIRMPVVRVPDDGMYSHLTMDPNERMASVVRIEEDSGTVIEIVPARHPSGVRRVWARPIDWESAFVTKQSPEAVPSRIPNARGPCPAGSEGPGKAALVGSVRDSMSGTLLPGARISVSRVEGEDRGSLTTMSDLEGRFVACGLPTGVPLEVVASFPRRMVERVVNLLEGVERHSLDLALVGEEALEAPRVRSTVAVGRDDVEGGALVGTVVDAATGEALAGAQVALEEAGSGAVTGPEGRFRMTAVPRGRHRLRVEYLGYEAAAARIEVAEDERTTVDVRLVPSAIAMAALEVTVPSPAAEARRSRGYTGWRLSADDIPESLSISVSELLGRRFAGVTYARSRLTACPVIEVRGGRISLVLLDGQPFRDTCVLEHILPQDIASIEVIPGLAGGITHGRAGGAGVIVIETRHGGE